MILSLSGASGNGSGVFWVDTITEEHQFSVGGGNILQCPRQSYATKNCAGQNVNCISTGGEGK